LSLRKFIVKLVNFAKEIISIAVREETTSISPQLVEESAVLSG